MNMNQINRLNGNYGLLSIQSGNGIRAPAAQESGNIKELSLATVASSRMVITSFYLHLRRLCDCVRMFRLSFYYYYCRTVMNSFRRRAHMFANRRTVDIKIE